MKGRYSKGSLDRRVGNLKAEVVEEVKEGAVGEWSCWEVREREL